MGEIPLAGKPYNKLILFYHRFHLNGMCSRVNPSWLSSIFTHLFQKRTTDTGILRAFPVAEPPPPPQPLYGPFSGTTRVSQCQLEENFWTLWCKGRLTEADTPTIGLGATPSELTSAHLHHLPIFTGRMPFLGCRPTNSVKALKATSAFGLGRRR